MMTAHVKDFLFSFILLAASAMFASQCPCHVIIGYLSKPTEIAPEYIVTSNKGSISEANWVIKKDAKKPVSANFFDAWVSFETEICNPNFVRGKKEAVARNFKFSKEVFVGKATKFAKCSR